MGIHLMQQQQAQPWPSPLYGWSQISQVVWCFSLTHFWMHSLCAWRCVPVQPHGVSRLERVSSSKQILQGQCVLHCQLRRQHQLSEGITPTILLS
jgi:hypothetical protein